MSIVSVLTVVNAPHSTKLDAEGLVSCLNDHSLAKQYPGHISCFFGEVSQSGQLAFAEHFGISAPALIAAASDFAKYSGEIYPLAG